MGYATVYLGSITRAVLIVTPPLGLRAKTRPWLGVSILILTTRVRGRPDLINFQSVDCGRWSCALEVSLPALHVRLDSFSAMLAYISQLSYSWCSLFWFFSFVFDTAVDLFNSFLSMSTGDWGILVHRVSHSSKLFNIVFRDFVSLHVGPRRSSSAYVMPI